MKVSGTAVFAVGLAARQAAASWDLNAPAYSAPENTYNQCSQQQQNGFDWSGLNPGHDVNSYGGFHFSGFSCSNNFAKRDVLLARGFQPKCITGTVPYGSGSAPSGPQMTYGSQFSIKNFQVTTDRDTDVTFCYSMPDGSTCKSTHSCSTSGSYVTNDQCGGATGVSWEIPGQQGGGQGCGIGIHGIGFHCGPPASSVPYTPSYTKSPYTSTPVYNSPPAHNTPPVYTPSTPVYSSPIYSSPVYSSPTPVHSSPIYSSPGSPYTPSGPGSPPGSPYTPSGPGSHPGSPYTPSGPVSPPYTPSGPGSHPGSPYTPSGPVSPPHTPSGPVSHPGYPYTPSGPGSSPHAPSGPASSPGSPYTPSGPGSHPGSPYTPSGPGSHPGSPYTPSGPGSHPGSPYTPSGPGSSPHTPSGPGSPPGSPYTPSGPGSMAGPKTKSPGHPSGNVPAKPSKVSPTSSSVPNVPKSQCPDVLAKCMNTWMFKTGCKNNMDFSCYCGKSQFTKMVLSCIDSWAESEVEKTAAMSCMAGICAPYIPQNPGIITYVPTTITVCPGKPTPPGKTPPATGGVPPATTVPGSSVYSPTSVHGHPVYTPPAYTPPTYHHHSVPASTITMTVTKTSTCTKMACTGRSSTYVGATTVTIPQVHFTSSTVVGRGGRGHTSTVPGLVPGTPAPVSASPTPYYPVPSSLSSVYGPAPTGGAPPVGTSPHPSTPVPTKAPHNAAGKVVAGSLSIVVAAVVALFFL